MTVPGWGVHTCHAECPCHRGGQPVPDFFVGPLPKRDNRAAPEVTPAHRAAVEAVRETLKSHGYTVVSMGHGSLRVGSATADEEALDV